VCEPIEDLDAQGLGHTSHGHGAGEEGTFEDVDRVEVEPDLDPVIRKSGTSCQIRRKTS
jgi:hypothetical protein